MSMALRPAKNSTAMTMYRIILGLATARILTPIREPSIKPTIEGTAIRGMTHPLFMYIQAADVSVMDSKNLLVAGRCVSSDRRANSALRVQASCMAMGQAAGAAAVLAVARNTTPLDVPLNEIRTLLAEHNAILPEASA